MIPLHLAGGFLSFWEVEMFIDILKQIIQNPEQPSYPNLPGDDMETYM